jgi:chromosome partitioning protein
VRNVNTLLHHRLQIWGVLPTFYDMRAKICTESLETLRGHFGDRCLPPVRATTRLKEAPAQAQSIFEYAPGTRGADDYQCLVDRVLGLATTAVADESPESGAVSARGGAGRATARALGAC